MMDRGRVRPGTAIVLAVATIAGTACKRVSREEARRLVERYNSVVSEAYRRGDVRLVDPVVGPNEGRKLTGLIGVRLDMGLTLDSELLSLVVDTVKVVKGELRVTTSETWRYRDRRIGTGEQVGEESVDSYRMLYIFRKEKKAWRVDEIRFLEEPSIGRKTLTWAASAEALHGLAGSTKDGQEAHRQ